MPRKTRLWVRGFKSIGIVDAPACEGSELVVVKRAAAAAGPTEPARIEEPTVDKKIVKQGDEFCALDADGKTVLGRHKTKADAQAQLDAIDANAAKRAGGEWAETLKQADSAVRPMLDAAETAFLTIATKADACEAKTFGEITSNQKVYDEMWRTWDRFSESVRSILQSKATDKAALLTKSADEFQAFLATAAPKWAVGETASKKEPNMATKSDPKAAPAAVTLTDEARKGLSPEAKAYIEHLEATAKAAPAGDTVAKADHDAALTAKDGEIAALKAQLATADPAAAEERAFKALPPDQQALVSKANARADEALKKAEHECELRETNEAVTAAKAYAPIAKPDVMGPLLRRVSKNTATAEDVTELQRVLKGAAELAKTSKAFVALGEDETGSPESAAGQIEQLAQKRVSEKGISIAVARKQVRNENRELALRERNEGNASVH